MTTRYTPAPWRAMCDVPNDSRRMALVVTSSEFPHAVAIDCTHSGSTYAEDCANARLVAQAPVLADLLRDWMHSHGTADDLSERTRAALRLVDEGKP